MTQELSDIRVKIDAIDNQVHDLLMERASLVTSVAAAKRKEGLQIVQPAREARMIRRLLARHNGPLPQATIVRIWRELVGSVSLLQTGLTVAVMAKDGHSDFWDMAKDYFGSAVPMKKINGTGNTVSAVREDDSSFGVMPWPEVDTISPWWMHLIDQVSDPISIICALPYASERREDSDAQSKGLIISKIEFMPSDNDVTFLGLKTSTSLSRAKLQESFAKAGYEILNIYSSQSVHDDLSYYMVEVLGYQARGAESLVSLWSEIGEVCLYCDVIGGYPIIPVLKRPIVI